MRFFLLLKKFIQNFTLNEANIGAVVLLNHTRTSLLAAAETALAVGAGSCQFSDEFWFVGDDFSHASAALVVCCLLIYRFLSIMNLV